MCGCGRPARTANQPPRDQVRRPARSEGTPRQLGDEGFVWRGPRRQQRTQGEQQR